MSGGQQPCSEERSVHSLSDSDKRSRMPTAAAPKKLYLFRLSTTAIPLPAGQTLEMSSGSYLVETADNKHILIDSGMTPDAPLSPAPPSTTQNTVLEHLAAHNL